MLQDIEKIIRCLAGRISVIDCLQFHVLQEWPRLELLPLLLVKHHIASIADSRSTALRSVDSLSSDEQLNAAVLQVLDFASSLLALWPLSLRRSILDTN